MARSEETKRVTVTVTEETYQRMVYWAEKENISINQFLNDALDMKIAFENKDYPLPTLEQARLNQVVDAMHAMASDFRSLRSVVTAGFDSFLRLTKGDNYLLDDEDGEL